MVLYCKCLNIAVDPADAHLEPASNIASPVPALVQASLAGGNYGTMMPGQLNIKFSFLVQQVMADSYSLYSCRNCGMAACAVNPSLNVIVLNGKLLDETEACKARLSSDYSAAFGIVVEAVAASGTDLRAAMSSPSSAAAIADLQRQLNNYCSSEESKTEEDIRRYEAGARERYRLLCESGNEQFRRLCSGLAKLAPPRDADDDDSAYERSSVEETTAEMTTNQARVVAASEKAPTGRVKTASSSVRQSSSNSDALFDLDEDVEEGDPFVCSDDEDNHASEADASGGKTEATGVNITHKNSRQSGLQSSRLSTSAAMPIPLAMRRRKSQAASDSDDDYSDNEGRMPDMKDMGASIKALAQSVGYDGTEMFGDLPRPRLNTHDRLLM